jgi:hypothetical protein
VALAPFEVFHPWWGRGFYGGFRGGAFGRTNIVNNVNVYNSFRNARVTGGAIGVNATGFGRGGQFSALNRSQLQSAGAVHGALPIAPDRSSLRLSDRAVSGRFQQARSQSFASRMQAPRVEHATFEQQQRGVQQMSRGNFNAPEAGNSGVGRAAESSSHGWNRFGEPIHSGSGGGASFNGNSAAGLSRGYNPSAVRIGPPIVQQRENSGGYSAPSRNYSQPRSFGGARPAASAPANRGGGGVPRGGGGGGGHSGGGGGGHHR